MPIRIWQSKIESLRIIACCHCTRPLPVHIAKSCAKATFNIVRCAMTPVCGGSFRTYRPADPCQAEVSHKVQPAKHLEQRVRGLQVDHEVLVHRRQRCALSPAQRVPSMLNCVQQSRGHQVPHLRCQNARREARALQLITDAKSSPDIAAIGPPIALRSSILLQNTFARNQPSYTIGDMQNGEALLCRSQSLMSRSWRGSKAENL